MRKLTYKIKEESNTYGLEFITDRSDKWTKEQYTRNRKPLTMELVNNETTEEKEPISRKVKLG
jgi:hypothetical protein|tara:strand:- start:134 stop:322 length:189 start_codon:yes stop_codon:yes gene_type:complete